MASAIVTPIPLTAEDFAPFGQVIAAPVSGRATFTDALSLGDRPVVVSTTRAEPSVLPIKVAQLERHPHSSQTFLPLDVARWLIVVSIIPQRSAVSAFLAGPGIGVTIGRGVWHWGLTVMERSAAFAVVMAKDGTNDDEIVDVEPFTVG